MSNRYWVEALFVCHKTDKSPEHIIEGCVGKDGLLVQLSTQDAIPLFNRLNCPIDEEGWFFNFTKDRYIAEKKSANIVIANPQLLYQTDYEIVT